jgi:hypothetical protein
MIIVLKLINCIVSLYARNNVVRCDDSFFLTFRRNTRALRCMMICGGGFVGGEPYARTRSVFD